MNLLILTTSPGGHNGVKTMAKQQQPLEPRANDTVVRNALELAAAIHRAREEGEPVSLHVVGHIALGELPPIVDNDGGLTLLPQINASQRVTLWSSENAVLDAEGAGRIFLVTGGQLRLDGLNVVGGFTNYSGGGCGWLQGVESRLIVRASHFLNCATTGWSGGCLRVGDGATATVSDSKFEDCSVQSAGDFFFRFGGGVGLDTDASVTLTSTRFERTRCVSSDSSAYGGGVGIRSGMLAAESVTFVETSASADSGFPVNAWGGGLGLAGGRATVSNSIWERTSVESNLRSAFGGGLGIHGGGIATVYDSTMTNCNVTGARFGQGGSVYASIGGSAQFFNVTLEDSHASNPELGAIISTESRSFEAAFLTIRQSCTSEQDRTTRLIGTFQGVGGLLLRHISFETNCSTLMREGTTLVGCNDPDPCAAESMCTMNNDTHFETPSCACSTPADPTRNAFLDPAPSPDSKRAELAPYAEGCLLAVQLQPEQLTLQENWWRASPRSTDARACEPFWQPGQPTPCRGGCHEDASDYCWEGRGLSGPLCRVCINDGSYYDTTTASCVKCPLKGGAALVATIAIVLGLLVMIVFLFRMHRFWSARRPSSPWLTWCATIVPRLGLTGKLKLAFSYYQVVLVMPELFSVSIPPEYFEWMTGFQWINFDWFALLVARECVGDFQTRLLIKALGPLVPLAALVVGGALANIVSAYYKAAADGSAVRLLEAAKAGMLRVLPSTLVAVFALVPSVSARIFSTFSCIEFRVDDDNGAINSFLYSDFAVECNSEQHNTLETLAAGLVVLWPVGVPVLFGGLLLASRGGTSSALTSAVAFLHAEYRDEFRSWDLLELMRKLTLTGFLFLVDQRRVLLRIVIALLLSTAHIVLLTVAQPYKQASTAIVAIACSVAVQFTLLVALLVKMYNEMPPEQTASFFGFDSAMPLVAIIFGFNVAVLFVAAALILYQLQLERQAQTARRLRKQDGSEVAAPALASGNAFHLFLSHAWGSGQDQMRIVKQRLVEMVPGLLIFLDVDDLKEGMGADDVERSKVVLVFCSNGYAESKNCMRELHQAVLLSKPLITLIEPEVNHGGMTQVQMQEKLLTVDGRFQEWGLAGQPGGSEISAKLFAGELIEWNRLGPMQDVTLRLIAERLLNEDLRGTTHMQGELAHSKLRLLPPAAGYTYHVYCSRNNAGAKDLADEVARARELTAMRCSTSVDELPTCRMMLVYLTARTWTSGEASVALATEVEAAMRDDVQLVLAHEMPGCGQQAREAVEFSTFFAADQTPPALLEKGIYALIAVPLKGGAWREASMALLAKELGAHAGSEGWVKRVLGACCHFAQGEASMERYSRGGRVIVMPSSKLESDCHVTFSSNTEVEHDRMRLRTTVDLARERLSSSKERGTHPHEQL